MLFAYIDETGLNPNAKAVTVAGLVAPLDQWISITAKWAARMKSTRISTFHAQPCRGGHEDFKLIPKSIREQLYTDLAEILAEHQPQPVSGSVKKTAWKFADRDKRFSDRYPTAYSFCFDLCLSAIDHIAEELGQEVTIVYAIHQQYLDRAKLVSKSYESSRRYLKWITKCTPNIPSKVIPLQAADMLAYEIYHHNQQATNQPRFDLLGRLEYPSVIYQYDARQIKKLIASGPIGMVD